MLPLHLSDFVPERYDLDRGVAHLGQGVAQLSQVLSFLADVLASCLPESCCWLMLLLAGVLLLFSLLNTLCLGLV